MNRLYVTCLFLFGIFFCLPSVFGKLPPIQFEQIRSNSGLSSDMVLSIVQDQFGFMWFGTSSGLNRYDGQSFEVFKKDSLKRNSINNDIIKALMVDRAGNLWIGTQGGGINLMNLQTGEIRYLLHEPDNPNSLSHNETLAIHQDQQGMVWIGTEHGLNVVNPETGHIHRFMPNPDHSGKLAASAVLNVYEDNTGTIWLGTWGGGLHKLIWDRTEIGLDQAYFEHFRYDPNDPHSIPTDLIWGIAQDHSDRMWIGSFQDGLAVLNPSNCPSAEAKPVIRVSGELQRKVGHQIFSSIVDSKGLLWLGTTNGLSLIDPNDSTHCLSPTEDFQFQVRQFKHQAIGIAGLPSNRIRCIYESRDGIIWLATEGGIAKYDPKVTLFHAYLDNGESESQGGIYAMCKSKKYGFWMGTNTSGLFRYPLSERKDLQFRYQPGHPQSLLSDHVSALWEDTSEHILWIGSDKGISSLDFGSKKVHNFPLSNGPKSAYVFSIKPHLDKELWISTDKGLFLFNKATGHAHFFTENLDDPPGTGLPDSRTGELILDTDSTIWVGSVKAGLIHIIPKADGTFLFENFLFDPEDFASLANKNYFYLLLDKENIWIGTTHGLLSFNKVSKRFRRLKDANGTNSMNIGKMLRDDEGYIWCTTSSGVSRFNPTNQTFISFDHRHGLLATSYYEYSVLKDRNGTMYFSNQNGFNEVAYQNVHSQFDIPEVFLRKLRINGQHVLPGDHDPILDKPILDQSFLNTDTLVLSYQHKVIDIDFSVIQYSLAQENQTAYWLEGFDKNWNAYGADQSISYTNLDPGTYKLHIKAANGDGQWSQDRVLLTIKILPPFWKSRYFQVGMIICLGLIFWGIYRYRGHQIQVKNQELKQMVAHRTQELEIANKKEREARTHAEQAAIAKSQFLANMSHEIRTPMNGMLGMAELLSGEELPPSQKDYVHTIIKSGESLLSIINDILDFSKIESGKFELESSPFSILQCVEEVLGLFGSKVQESPIELLYSIDSSLPDILIGDGLRLRQVLLNLVSNAIKFTERGEIIIHVEALGQQSNIIKQGEPFDIRFSVSDTGIGIPEDKQESLFEAFTQVDASTTRKYGGTGLGLAISSKLVGLMKGRMEVSSQVGKGTCFSFFFPTQRSMEQADEIHQGLDVTYLRQKKVIFIDDHPGHITMISKFIKQWDMHLYIAYSAADAIQFQQQGIQFDLLICNHVFSDTARVEAIEKSFDYFPEVPKIHLSPLMLVKTIESMQVFAEVLPKPLKQKSLYDALVRVLKNDPNNVQDTVAHIQEQTQAITTPLRIMLAEDNQINQKLALKILSKVGYEADLANNGAEALALLEKQSYDIILMDVMMPEVDGLEATRRIRANSSISPQPIIIAVTANAMDGDREMCLAAGMDNYMAKPFKQQDLKDMLSKYVNILFT